MRTRLKNSDVTETSFFQTVLCNGFLIHLKVEQMDSAVRVTLKLSHNLIITVLLHQCCYYWALDQGYQTRVSQVYERK